MFDLDSILTAGSLAVLALVIFAESGLLLGLFLPGDTLLIAAGVFASEGKLPLIWLIIVAAISTLAGYQLGYYLGLRAGPQIFKRKDGILFREDYMKHTENFFNRHGWKTVLFARFIAVVRTIVPLVAGMGKMNTRIFTIFNIVGGITWSGGIILLSYFVGKRIPNLDNYIKYFVLGAILLTTAGIFVELAKHKQQRREVWGAIREEYRFLFRKGFRK